MIKYDQIFKNDESSSEHHDFAYKAYIKKIFLEVPDYTYHHHPHQDDSEDSDPKHIFMGREDIKARFLDILLKGKVNGVYLVTGYRGMGKTSFVNKVIDEYSNIEKKEVCKIKISLAQSKLEEIDILRYIVKALLDDTKKDKFQILNFFQDAKLLFNILSLCFIFLMSLVIAQFLNESFSIYVKIFLEYVQSFSDYTKSFLEYIKIAIFISITLLLYLIMLLIRYFLNIIIVNKPLQLSIISLNKKLESLYERCYASTSEEESKSFLIKEIFSLFRKKAKIYPIAAAKEIEYEIIDILKEFNHKKVIFVFDELDKVEPTQDRGLYQTYSSEELTAKTNLNDLRDRKHIILKVLSSMKHLLTEARARFIFIAGREMFDASLADISDRQSLLGSIIHQTFYVESFLHENPTSSFSQENSLSIYIEKYLEKILLPASKLPKGLLRRCLNFSF